LFFEGLDVGFFTLDVELDEGGVFGAVGVDAGFGLGEVNLVD